MTYPHRQRVDRSPTLILATCTCGWREPANTVEHAWTLNTRHAHTHGNATQAAAAARKARSRRRKDT